MLLHTIQPNKKKRRHLIQEGLTDTQHSGLKNQTLRADQMDCDAKEVEAANTLVAMAKGLLLPDGEQEGNGVAKETQQQQVVSEERKKHTSTIPAITLPEQEEDEDEDEDEEEEEGEERDIPIGTSINAEFPFLIGAFLSAVRVALITPTVRVVSFAGARFRNKLLPSLTFNEIMQRVRTNPGDVRVLEMASTARLQDLLRGALRIFLSSSLPSPPPGNSWWRPLVVYHKHVKHWSWIGPLSNQWPQADTIPTSPQAWGMSLTILNWLAERYGHWLNATRGVLQGLASLPPPPLSLMPLIPRGERYQLNRNLKNSVLTIEPSCEEVKAHFRREESLRYSIPGQAFSYTTRDGLKSSVVPLVRKCYRRPAKKPREHFILKPDRPPSFTVLCLVRDAAARLPHGSGTRSDICTLVRDSQYLEESVEDADLTQVVIGALDRLTSEWDPCLTFDKYHRLWHYLHGSKDEEDFLEHPTLSRKRMKNKQLIGSEAFET